MSVNIKRLTLVFILLLALMGMIRITTIRVKAEQVRKVNLSDEEKIRQVIYAYFDKRYYSRMTSQVQDFHELIDSSSQASSFLQHEIEKQEIEIYNAKQHHLAYTRYEYTLDFNSISIDKNSRIAVTSLREGHDVIFEISKIISASAPVISKMRNLDHTIVLRETKDGWKIILDSYEDHLWRFLKASTLSKEELLISINRAQNQTPLSVANTEEATSLCNLPADQSTHTYYRSGVVAYAHRYAYEPNPAYHYFTENDCTNFISQAIHHGSDADEEGSNTYGWYYNYYNGYQNSDYSASWTDVQFLYEFITQYAVWSKGPEGCVINNSYAALAGDLVQFEWNDDGNTNWDHAMIIVRKETPPDDPYYPYFYVAGHSTDVDNYPLESIIYQSRRFIRIDRIDGYATVFAPLILRGSIRVASTAK
ncbi:MAG: amidase domain-containing protein [Chloroflexota bacterium]